MSVKASIATAKKALQDFRQTRLEVARLDEGVKAAQPELIESLKELGVNNETGIVFEPSDPNKGAAYVQQNQGSEVWDEDEVIKWLRSSKRKSNRLWLACSTRVLDMRKFEAEVAAGNISKVAAKKMKYTTDPAKPFIRFGKINKGSIK